MFRPLIEVSRDILIKRYKLDVTCLFISLFNAQHVSDVNTSILSCLRLICWVISWVVLLWYDVCWCYVVVWLGWCCIRMQAEAMLNMFRMLIHPSSGACTLFVELFHGLYCSGTMRGFSLHPDTTPPQPNHNVTPTRIVPEQYNPWNNSTNKSQVPEDECINIRNMMSIK